MAYREETCIRTQVIGENTDCNAQAHHLAAASGIVYFHSANQTHASHILSNPHLKAAAVFSATPQKEKSCFCIHNSG